MVGMTWDLKELTGAKQATQLALIMTVSSESPFLDIFVDILSAEVGDETTAAATDGGGSAA